MHVLRNFRVFLGPGGARMSGMVSKPGEVSGRARLSGGIYNISEDVPDRSIVFTAR